MANTATLTTELIAELRAIEADQWAERLASIPAWHPRAETNGDGPPAPDADPEPEAQADPPADEDGEPVTLTRAEHAALLAERDDARKAAATANRRQKEREREAAKGAGKFEELYAEETKRREALEGKLTGAAIRSEVERVAERLNFRNLSVARRLVDVSDVTADLDGDDVTIDAANLALIERRLKAEAEADPSLLKDAPRGMLAGAGSGNGGGPAQSAGNAAMNAAIRRGAGRG